MDSILAVLIKERYTTLEVSCPHGKYLVVPSQAYLLMQVHKTKDIGDALGFGSALLFSSVFGMPSVSFLLIFTIGYDGYTLPNEFSS